MAIVSCNYGIGTDGGCELRQRRRTETFFHLNGFLTKLCFVTFVVFLRKCVTADTSVGTDSSPISIERELIINGDSARPQDHQFFLRSWPDAVVNTKDILCGASLIYPDIILTAAHCHGGFNSGAMAYNPDTEKLDRYNTVDLQIAYPNYYQNLNIINYDLMIMRLSLPITDIEPVLLNADPDFPVKKSSVGNYVLEGLGVGLTESGFVSRGLEVGYFNAMTNDQCSKRLGNAYPDITDDIICADPFTDDSICAGDSGGPLTARVNVPGTNGFGSSPWNDQSNIKPVQVGITSFGNDCQVDLIPDGFARVSYFHKWIKEQVCKYSRDPPVECFEYFASEEYLEFIASEDGTATIWPDKARITMRFQHDFLADQTTFVVRNTANNEIEYVGPHYVPDRGEFVVSHFHLPVPGNYVIEVHDSGGDGLRNPDYTDQDYPDGSWTISAEYSNGARLEGVASGDHKFKSLQQKSFTLPRRLPAPNLDPTETMAPTTTPIITNGRYSNGVYMGNTEPESASSSLSIYSPWVFTILPLGLAGFLL